MFQQQVYIQRRERLAEAMPDCLIIVLGNAESAFNYADNTYRFRQDSTFLYLFGLDQPNLAAVMDTSTGQTTIYGDDVTMDDIVWTGPQPSLSERAALCGVSLTRPSVTLPEALRRLRQNGRNVHYVPPYRGENVVRLSELLGRTPAQIVTESSERLVKALVSMRSIKEPCEIEDMDKQMKFGYNMHRAAMRMAREGMTENQIMARLEMEALLGGGPVSFPTICTTHGETLHNHGYIHTLHNGQLLLVDAGCESHNHYATDNTRTTPVGGRFSTRQREIYEIVLAACDAVARESKPGVFYKDMHLLAARTIVEGLKNLGLMQGDTDEAVAQGAYALFMPHGIGHMLGLDVHDMESYGEDLVGYDDEVSRSSQFGLSALRLGRRLQEGFCVTDEPGIYFIPELIDRWRRKHICDGFINYARLESYKDFGGIRIEDDLLITANGCRIMGEGRLPSTVAEVEAEAARSGEERRDVLTNLV